MSTTSCHLHHLQSGQQIPKCSLFFSVVEFQQSSKCDPLKPKPSHHFFPHLLLPKASLITQGKNRLSSPCRGLTSPCPSEFLYPPTPCHFTEAVLVSLLSLQHIDPATQLSMYHPLWPAHLHPRINVAPGSYVTFFIGPSLILCSFLPDLSKTSYQLIYYKFESFMCFICFSLIECKF